MANIRDFVFQEKPAKNEADPGRAFFVTVVRDDGKVGVLAGPYGLHDVALAKVEEAKQKAYDVDPRAFWYAFGTIQAPEDVKAVFGAL